MQRNREKKRIDGCFSVLPHGIFSGAMFMATLHNPFTKIDAMLPALLSIQSV
jgi:hypothetical protein